MRRREARALIGRSVTIRNLMGAGLGDDGAGLWGEGAGLKGVLDCILHLSLLPSHNKAVFITQIFHHYSTLRHLTNLVLLYL